MTSQLSLAARGLLMLTLLVVSCGVLAHGKASQTTPADGASIDAMPEQLVVRFDGPHRVTLMRLSREGGETTRLQPANPGQASKKATAPAPELEPGSYTLEWRALSADGHAVKGNSRFTLE